MISVLIVKIVIFISRDLLGTQKLSFTQNDHNE